MRRSKRRARPARAFSYTASATDILDGSVATSCTPASGSTFPFGATTVTCTATDSHANVGTKTFTVTVKDTTGPVVDGAGECDGRKATSATGATFSYTASATDTLDGPVATSCTPASGATFAFGATTVTCTRPTVTPTWDEDLYGDGGRHDRAGGDGSGERDGRGDGCDRAVFTFAASATDTLDGPVATSCTPASGATFAFGATTVTCTATDSHANVATKTFTVTVKDTTGPVVTVPANATVEATSATGAAYTYSASATDLLDGSVATSCTPASGSTFAFGATTVTCTATTVTPTSRPRRSR